MAETDKSSNPTDEQSEQSPMTEAEIDQNLADTFPASDPPSWTLGTDHAHTSPASTRESDDDSETE